MGSHPGTGSRISTGFFHNGYLPYVGMAGYAQGGVIDTGVGEESSLPFLFQRPGDVCDPGGEYGLAGGRFRRIGG